jgi:hypothetical protein
VSEDHGPDRGMARRAEARRTAERRPDLT